MIISTFTAAKLVPEIYDDHLIINYCFKCRDHGHNLFHAPRAVDQTYS